MARWQLLCWTLCGLLLLVAIACGARSEGADGSGAAVKVERYTDEAGWSLEYPSELHLERSQAHMRISVWEATVASFEPQPAVRSGTTRDGAWLRVDPPRNEGGHFPPDAVAFRLLHRAGGPGPVLESQESRFPLRLSEFEPSSWYAGTEPRPVERAVVANGRSYVALAWIGAAAKPQLRDALEAVVSSLAFPPSRVGTVVGDGFSVFGSVNEYPLGSVTRVVVQEQPFYLVHAPGGFYAVGWRWQTLTGGYKSRCDVKFDEQRLEFVCPSLGARWDRVGRVLTRPTVAQLDDPLNVSVAKPSHDGKLLVHPGVARFADDRFARMRWPGWQR
jgi:hypothetical protein